MIQRVLKEGRNFLLEPEAKTLCSIYSIPVTVFRVASTREDAVRLAKEIGFPVVMKIVSPDIVHKTDVGGVILNINNEEEVVKAYDRILSNVKKRAPKARISGVLVEEMAKPSIEVIVGCIKDRQFGHAVMFGLGGVFVEVLEDVTFRIVPLTRYDAEEMIKEVKGYKVLKGYRGFKADINSIVDIILKVSKMVSEIGIINQLDLNPIYVYEKGAKVVDARIILD